MNWPKCVVCRDDLPSEAEYGPTTCGSCLVQQLNEALLVLHRARAYVPDHSPIADYIDSHPPATPPAHPKEAVSE